MNIRAAPTDLDSRVDSMLQRVYQDREHRCQQARSAADLQAREIVRSARADARAAVAAAVAQERSRLADGLLRAKAAADLEEQRRAQSDVKKLLEGMWSQIRDALEARWRDPAHQREWIEAALHQAQSLMSDLPSWHVEHGMGWSTQQHGDFEKQAGRPIEWTQDAQVAAGLRIRAEGVCLDATVQGLLANRGDIESAFLAEYSTHE